MLVVASDLATPGLPYVAVVVSVCACVGVFAFFLLRAFSLACGIC